MQTCRVCGESNPDRARFCLACGAALEVDSIDRTFRKTVTVVFCDVTGSTQLGERLDPEPFYAPPGHTPTFAAGTELLQISPTDELSLAMAAIMKNMEAMQGGG